MRWFLGAMCALVLSACNPVAQMDSSERLIAEFQADMHGPSREGSTRSELDDAYVRLKGLVRSSLGELQSSERTGFNLNSNNGETTTVITMSSTYQNGEATETFTFKGTGDQMELHGWDINSEVLAEAMDSNSELGGSAPRVPPPPPN
ncbi:hypothetical protein [Erythrobacter sp. EC-HK427]|uniref:hypothetical protein n=1 Tax=Erythrobacter sp. EC-HK427 TaxID=2038396 RepID=UPI001254CC44|nr:hypothetical protein [Erythrobacter sp. EC-HK427]VVT12940.1 conserved exported hypothetical protein [Erythrobacter sp. EC-HK427]